MIQLKFIVNESYYRFSLAYQISLDGQRVNKLLSPKIDDHDRCEWVNVSSGTGSPGLSRTKSIES